MKTSTRIYVSLLLLGLTFSPMQGQYSGLDLLDNKTKREISYQYINGFIVVKLYYANVFQLNFLFDTGASHNILFKKHLNDIIGIEYTDTILVSGADLDLKMEAMVSRNIPMKLENTSTILRDIIVLEKDFLELEQILGIRIDGILGGDFFRGLIVGVNHKKKRLTIYDPNRFVPKKDYTRHNIDIHNYKPYIKSWTKIEENVDTLNYLIDTGASLALLVHSNRNEKIELPDNVIIGNLGKGLGGEIHGYVGMIDGIRIDQYELPNVITSFQDIDSSYLDSEHLIREGIIGNVALSRFNMIIDYVREVLYLQEISKLDEAFEYDKSGMLIYALGENLNEYYIKTIYPDTPAAEAGLRPGDKIIKIGFWPARFYSLSGILKKLRGKDGKKIKLKILRNGEKIKIQFRLRNLFRSPKEEKGDSPKR